MKFVSDAAMWLVGPALRRSSIVADRDPVYTSIPSPGLNEYIVWTFVFVSSRSMMLVEAFAAAVLPA